MKKASKVLFCALTIALVLCSVTLPCFADWTDIIGKSDMLITPRPSEAILNGWGSEIARGKLESTINLAYESNAFNGGRPIAIYYQQAINSTGGNIIVATISNEYPAENYKFVNATFEWDDEFSAKYLSVEEFGASGATTDRADLKLYTFLQNGSLILFSDYTVSYVEFTPETRAMISYYDGEKWYADPTDPFFLQYYQSERIPDENGVLTYPSNDAPEEVDKIFTTWRENSSVTIVERPVYKYDYDLDVPAIITAVPNGAKQIINNAFGFEIFGINVAGLLSVLLIVTIVAFVVRWLMSR